MLDGYVPSIIVVICTLGAVAVRDWYYRRRGYLNTPSWRSDLLIVVWVIALAATLELSMGRVPWCTCGYIKLWHGIVKSSENSQQVADWYTFSHIIHGMLFYWMLRIGKLKEKISPSRALVFAIMLEATWEVLENTDFVIGRYREATISLDYYGDSVLNSVCDMIAAVIGFVLAMKLPTRISIALIIGMELFVGFWIRDNLMLNIIMLLHPVEAIKVWQSGG